MNRSAELRFDAIPAGQLAASEFGAPGRRSWFVSRSNRPKLLCWDEGSARSLNLLVDQSGAGSPLPGSLAGGSLRRKRRIFSVKRFAKRKLGPKLSRMKL